MLFLPTERPHRGRETVSAEAFVRTSLSVGSCVLAAEVLIHIQAGLCQTRT